MQVKPLRTMIVAKTSDGSGGMGGEAAGRVMKSAKIIASWIALLQRSHSRSMSRTGSHRNSRLHEPEAEGHNDASSLALLDSDVFLADKFKIDQVMVIHKA